MGAQGTATVDFGASPGKSDVTITVAATGVLTTSAVEAWLRPVVTADHSVDEHLVEEIDISAHTPVANSFSVFAKTRNKPLTGQWSVWWVWN